jgi:hypothetical protein
LESTTTFANGIAELSGGWPEGFIFHGGMNTLNTHTKIKIQFLT